MRIVLHGLHDTETFHMSMGMALNSYTDLAVFYEEIFSDI